MMKTSIVFDLEATCEDRAISNQFDNETIEIGAVKVQNGVIVDEFQAFIRPVRTSTLTNFCKELTSIKQEDVDTADGFKTVMESFEAWAEQDGGEVEYLSWGFYDRKQLEKDAKHHGIEVLATKNHRSLKHEHQTIKGLKRPVGVQKALTLEKLTFEGTHHRGIDDARNIARIFIKAFLSK